MFHNPLKDGKRYEFVNKNDPLNHYLHFIITQQDLSDNEVILLHELLASFPHGCHDDWIEPFEHLNIDRFPQKLRKLAANAYYGKGHTVLGAAADWGDVGAVQQLLDMGADIDALDIDGKSALNWAIINRHSLQDPDSLFAADVVQCLLLNGADTDRANYLNKDLNRKMTPLDYAKRRGQQAAITMLEKHNPGNRPGFK
jgi:hypothetical protein